jgi:transposase
MTRAMHPWGAYEFGRALSLSLRDREIVIDRTCARCHCEYEWDVHVAFFAKRAGLNQRQIASLTAGSADDACWTQERDRLLIRAVDALHDHSDIPDDLWQAIEPLLPPPPRRNGGRPRIDDRACLAGIVYQLRTSIPWRLLPVRELGCGSPITCWRRLRDWQRAGVWQQLHHPVLDQLGRAGQLDWSRASLDSISVRAKRGGLTGPNPVDRGMPGSKYHLLTDRGGIPLAVVLWPPTPTTPSYWSPWSTPCRPSRARTAGPIGPASAPPSCIATKGL